jgi:hypothetical protein
MPPGFALAMAPSPGWLVSPRFDLAWIIGPPLGAAAAAIALPSAWEPGLATWLLLVVGIDVAHTYATLWRTYLDPRTRAERAGWLWAAPLVALATTAGAAALAPEHAWRALAYVAVFHFVRQQGGFAMLYRQRAGLPTRDLPARLEKWTVEGACWWCLLWWHAHLPRPFDWFVPGEFVPVARAWVMPAGAAWLGLLAAHLAVTARAARLVAPGTAWLVASTANWAAAIPLSRTDLGFSVANVVGHGVPYFALVAVACAREQPRRFGRGRDLAAAGALCVGLAMAEEMAWDWSTWREHVFTGSPPGELVGLAFAALAVPQLTHYLLDGVAWKGSPRLRTMLDGTPGN